MNRLQINQWAGVLAVALILAVAGTLSAGENGGGKAKAKVDPRIGGMRLLPGYVHKKLQGIDSIVGKIEKPGGLSIMYDIGGITKPGQPRLGGSFTDAPKTMPANSRHWYKEQIVNGLPMHIAYAKNGYLFVSFQKAKTGINFSVRVNNAEEIVEAMLMLVTYPVGK